MAAAMQRLRAAPPASFGPFSVERTVDRARGQRTGSPTRDLPGNVVVFEGRYEGDALAGVRLVFRPSGTEPKLKVYVLGWTDPGADPDRWAAADGAVRAVADAAQTWVRGVLAEHGGR